jgi:uncharacterized repeat protein (TIGR01451 family)
MGLTSKPIIMKKIILSILFLLGISFGSRAQTQPQITLSFVFDSTFAMGNCPTPVETDLYVYGEGNGFAQAGIDSVNLTYHFGDGSNAQVTVPIIQNLYFYTFLNHTYTLPGSYTVAIIADAPGAISDTIFHNIYISDVCGNIDGYTYIDANGNCQFDAGDDTLKYFPIQVLDMSGQPVQYAYSDGNGFFALNLPSGFSFQLLTGPSPISGGTVSCPASGVYNITTTTSPQSFDFGITCNPGFDLVAGLSGWGFRPGFNGYVYPSILNTSCATVSGTATLTIDGLTSFTGVNNLPAGATVNGNSISWPFVNVAGYFNSFHWWNQLGGTVQLLTSLNAQIGDTVCFTLTITPTAGDNDPSNNTVTVCFPVVNSWDPNIKEVSPAGTGITGDIAPGTMLTYTVHFQNTGNAPAIHVNIIDTLESDLDLSTLQILSASHQMNFYRTNDNILKFEFLNINLPDSTNDEPNSHGRVVFKVRAKSGLTPGTEINNTAHIFFDFNPAIVTNTTLNTIEQPLAVAELKQSFFRIFPNPASDIAFIQSSDSFSGNIELIDVRGAMVKLIPALGKNQISIDLSELASGVYQVRISGTNQSERLNVTK